MSLSSNHFFSRRSLFMASLSVLVGAALAVPANSAWAGGGMSLFKKKDQDGTSSSTPKKGFRLKKAKKSAQQSDGQFQGGQDFGQGMIEVNPDGSAKLPDQASMKKFGDQIGIFLSAPDARAMTTVLIDEVRLESVDATSGIAGDVNEGAVAALGAEFQSCGAFFGGSSCLDSGFTLASGGYEIPLVLQHHSALVFKLLAVGGKPAGLVLITEISYEHPHKVLSIQVAHYDRKLKQPEDVKAAYLKGRVTPVLSASIAGQQVRYAIEKLKTTTDPKTLLHFSDYLLRNTSSCVEVLEKLSGDFRQITQGDSAVYQIALLDLVTEFSLERGFVQAIASDLLESQNDEVAHLAAMVLAETGLRGDLVKQKVRQAMASKLWKTRKRAVEAFKHIRENALDDAAFLDSLLDSDNDVKEAARIAVAQLTLTNAHLEHLDHHLGSKNWSTRLHMIELIGKIQTPEATRLLLKGLVDSDNDVRSKTDGLLKLRNLQKADVPVLQELAKSKQNEGRVLVVKYLAEVSGKASRKILIELSTDSVWNVRFEAVKALKDRPQGEVTAALIQRVEDSDNDVKGAALKNLSTRTLFVSDLPAVEGLLNSKNWGTRQTALGYLAKIDGSDSTGLILARLCDSDKDVRANATNLAKVRPVGEFELKVLGALAHQATCEGRELLPEFLARAYVGALQQGESQAQSASAALSHLTHLSKDKNWSVRMAVVKGLESQRSADVKQLFSTMSADTDNDVRKKVTSLMMGMKFN